MRLIAVLVCFSTFAMAQDEPVGAILKRVQAAAEKIKDKDQKTKLDGLREAASLKADAISLLPLVFKEMNGTGKKGEEAVILQAVITSEAIDAEIHSCIMGIKPGTTWAERAKTLSRINGLPDDRIKRIEFVVDWMIPQFKTLRPSANLRPKHFLDKKKKLVAEAPVGDDLSVDQLIFILNRFDGKYTEQREKLATLALKTGNGWVREKGYMVFWFLAKQPDCPKDKKAILHAIFVDGLSDPEPDIQLQCVAHLGSLGADAKESADRIRKMAATHESKTFRDAAADALRKIESGGKEKPKKIVPMTIDPPKDKK